MKLEEEFFNKVVSKIDSIYFPDVKYYRDNKNCEKIHHAVENFNNGIISYDKLIKIISKYTKDSELNIHKIVSDFIIEWK